MNMATAKKKKGGYLGRFLKKADKAIDEGIKKADEFLDDAVEFGEMTAKQASKASKEFRKQAEKERKELQKKGIDQFNKSLSAAKGMASNTEDDLELLEKLAALKKSGAITDKEFKEKKKKILDRI